MSAPSVSSPAQLGFTQLITRVSEFEPRSSTALMTFMAGETWGVRGYAAAIDQLHNSCCAELGLDPASIQGVADYAAITAELARAMTAAHGRFTTVYKSVLDAASNGVVMPYDGRFFGKDPAANEPVVVSCASGAEAGNERPHDVDTSYLQDQQEQTGSGRTTAAEPSGVSAAPARRGAPYDSEMATLMQGFEVGRCPLCNRGAVDHTFTADDFNHAHVWCVYADGEATGAVAGRVIEHGPHEVVKACGTPWYHNPADPRHRPGRVCHCGGTGWVRVCTICRATNCDGVHDFCLECDGTGEISCDTCGGDGDLIEQVTVDCPDCGGRAVDCGVCDGEGQLYEERERRCAGCKGTGNVRCPACVGKVNRS